MLPHSYCVDTELLADLDGRPAFFDIETNHLFAASTREPLD
jgi:hypothetical protein